MKFIRGFIRRSRRKKTPAEGLKTLIILTPVLLVAALLTVLLPARPVRMPDDAMAPRFEAGGLLLVNRMVPKIGTLHHSDVITYVPDANFPDNYRVGRIHAIPGETVSVAEGRLQVNGEDTGESVGTQAGTLTTAFQLAPGEYVVLNDNRANVNDSRAVNIGVVSESKITGRVQLQLTPKPAWTR
ncbi:MAG: signal peptidase I [Eubacteriales bacterium]|nr:signal peptidase I [Eubacteriales bacterium]